MSHRVVIITGSSLCHNPRVLKEATALAEAGFEVEVLGAWLDTKLKEQDQQLLANIPFRFTPVLDANQDKWSWMQSRLCVKAARRWHQRTGMETRWQLGYTVGALARAVRQRKADLFIAHSEPALWAIHQLEIQNSKFKIQNFHIGVDMEDWFSEDLTPEARKQRPVKLLRNLEERALKHGMHVTCTSQAMSEALAREYGCRPPAVIYNAFPWADRKTLDGKKLDRRNLRVPSLHWYSQTLGLGRGLEELFAALPDVKHPMEIHLRGNPVSGFQEWLAARLPDNWRSRVFVHDLVSNGELLSRITEHDIGFAGEQMYCWNKNLTVTNKILHYLLGGLAVVASNTVGQREIAEQAAGAVRIYPSGDSSGVARELNALLASTGELQSAKAAALKAAEKNFCWERQVPVLVGSIGTGLAAATSSTGNF